MESVNGTAITRNSDSGYSNSCSNTNSRKSASSKSKHSESNSSGSSGYCGAGATDAVDPKSAEQASATADGTLDITKRTTKDDRADLKKKLKSTASSSHSNVAVTTVPSGTSNIVTIPEEDPSSQIAKEPTTDTNMVVEMVVPPTAPEDAVVAEEVAEKAEQIDDKQLDALVLLQQDLTMPGNNTTSTIAESPITTDIVEKEAQADNAGQWNKNAAQHVQEMEDKQSSKTGTAQPPPNSENEGNEQMMNRTLPENGFCCVISMYDGVVLYTTPSLTSVLGFPKDMWLGRSFIDFVHPKDRETFSSQVTTGIALPLVDAQRKYKDYKNSLYVCLRKYRGLRSNGFGVMDKGVSYQAFQLNVKFKHVAEPAPESNCLDINRGMFLVVIAIPVYTCYKVPGERKKSMKFGMRHTASCTFSHVDPDVVTNFGFLPQDMLGKSVFDFYHPEDMPFLKEIYESVMQTCHIAGSVLRSKPYRFAVQNGGYAMVETEWSSFVNPWSRKLEFVTGLHRVLEGPPNPDIFETCSLKYIENVSEEVVKESKLIQGEILLLLNKELPRPTEAAKHEVSKRCKDLANFMETLMDEVNIHQLELPPRIDLTTSPAPALVLPPSQCSDHQNLQQSIQHLQDDLPPYHNDYHNHYRHKQSCTKTTTTSPHNQQQSFHDGHHLLQERDSVMLGEISPHHEYYDSKSSSETPPSYNQLNYNENLQRFFESKPKTTVSDESAGSSGAGAALIQTDSGGESDAKPSAFTHYQQACQNSAQNNPGNNQNDKCLSPIQNSGHMSGSGSGSAENMSSASNPNMETAKSHNIVSKESFKPLHLTESLLSRHNEDMEKIMLKKHREQRFSTKENKKSHSNNHHHNQIYHYNQKTEKFHALERANINHRMDHASPVPLLPAHGVKRCCSYSPEGASDNQHKISKHRYKSGVANQKEEVGQASTNHGNAQQLAKQQVNIYKNQRQVHTPIVCNGEMSYQAGLGEVNLWPPFSVAASSLQNTYASVNTTPVGPTASGGLSTAATPGMFPVYYLPAVPTTQRTVAGTTQYGDPAAIINSGSRYQVQYMPGLFYNHGVSAASTLYPSSPMLCPTLPVMPMPMPMHLLSTSVRTAANPAMNSLQMNGHSSAAILHNSGNGPRPTVANQHLAAIEQNVSKPVVSGLQRFQRRASQETSVKVEPGSAMSSVASASLANKCVKKQHVDILQQRLDATNHSTTMDESSSCYSSSYSSFLKTDTGTGSGSNDDYNPTNPFYSPRKADHHKKQSIPSSNYFSTGQSNQGQVPLCRHFSIFSKRR
ncbi:unnamed protein product [Acanthoscelides obtectus]|uniref:Period circadian protein n=1 Tax=Acanthoscelides obtectus TaxID=200917 RepID=A0A9P0PWE2_ACAOB|nr:unnamed protein product [Acanthoscelides obtectus]CAK1663104.1 Period circadian protein [Acanthoscelides obtectus]